MNTANKIPYFKGEEHEPAGYVVHKDGAWQAQTIFGLPITYTTSKEEAERILDERGLSYLTGVWRYFDKDEQDWFPCVITEAYETKVIVKRTNELGYDDPDLFKRVILLSPDESVLIKTS